MVASYGELILLHIAKDHAAQKMMTKKQYEKFRVETMKIYNLLKENEKPK